MERRGGIEPRTFLPTLRTGLEDRCGGTALCLNGANGQIRTDDGVTPPAYKTGAIDH